MLSETSATAAPSLGCNKLSFSGTSLHKKLRFDFVTIKDMSIELGEHPPSAGAPITIGWQAHSTRHVHIDVYEAFNGDSPRKKEEELRLSACERANLLLRAGYDVVDIAEASAKARKVLKQRAASTRSQKWEIWSHAREKATRTMNKIACNPAA